MKPGDFVRIVKIDQRTHNPSRFQECLGKCAEVVRVGSVSVRVKFPPSTLKLVPESYLNCDETMDWWKSEVKVINPHDPT